MNIRNIAFDILLNVEKGFFAQDLLEETSEIETKDRALLTQLVYGTIRHQGTLDKLISGNTPLINRIILRLAGYQLFFLTRIPNHAIVNESVQLAKRYASLKASRFINAVLRNWCRNPPKIDDKLSHPKWLIERWQKLFGVEDTKKLCEFNNGIPPVIVRIKTLKDISSEVLKQFERCRHPLAFKLIEKKPIRELLGYKEGLFQVQDESGMYIVDLLGVEPGMKVLDLCASPGGKTCYIAQLMQGRGEVIALDTSKEKTGLIEENCKRLGIAIVETVTGDGIKVKLGDFDRILVDAPCSNTGVFRRRIEARWRLKPSDFQRLADLQLKLLENASTQLKPNGRLVYSTCSIDPSENIELVKEFLGKHKEFELIKIVEKIPFKDNMDGVFGALINKK